MEGAWFWNRVLGLSLSMVVLCAPGPLWAWTPHQSSPPATTDLPSASTAHEDAEGDAVPLGGAGRSASQRDPLSSTAADRDAAETQSFGERSSSALGSTRLTTEPLSSTPVSSTTEASHRSSSGWGDLVDTERAPGGSSVASRDTAIWSWTETEDSSVPQDGPDSTLRLGDVDGFVSRASVDTNSAYASTTMSRVGERTLLSVTSFHNNNTSSGFTEDSLSHQPPATWALSPQTAETEDYTHSISMPKTEVMDATQRTDSFKETRSETGRPASFGRTATFTNSTENHQTFTSEVTPKLTPSAPATESSISQNEAPVSSTAPMISATAGPTNTSGTNPAPLYVSTEAPTVDHSVSTSNQAGTQGVPSRTEEDTGGLGSTIAPPTVSSRTDDSLTEAPQLITEILSTTTTTSAAVTERSQRTEEDTFAGVVLTTSAPPSDTSTSKQTTDVAVTAPPQTQPAISRTELPTEVFTTERRTTAAAPVPGTAPSWTRRPATKGPTGLTTARPETSSSPPEVTTASRLIATSPADGTRRSAETRATQRPTEGEGTQPVTTNPPAVQPPPPPPRNPCVSNPCMNGGMCVSYVGHLFTCRCQQAWTGPTCTEDVNECDKDPCPHGSRCVNTRGSFSCECPLGFDLEDGRTCTRAKTFLGTFSVNGQPHDAVVFRSATMHEIQREIIQLLNASLSVLRGYSRSTLSRKEEGGVRIFAVNMFSVSANVTSSEVFNRIQTSMANCSSSLSHCRMVLQHQLSYHAESLCAAQQTRCDTERSSCSDAGGMASCRCLPGYYKHNPEDLSCLECGDGYKLENGSCVACMFGFGGFNCGNFYKLIAVVVSPAGGGILLILIVALIVTCCKRNKNDLNKIIFKNGDLQMSPYTDFPKTNRISMEWGRETIEMQENGSTKNLLQMTDIYYSPALRNADLERNGLYPFTGLPGSRHSCIYPAQWNPSFISDDSRRRDYF